jgi:hypothetical protein
MRWMVGAVVGCFFGALMGFETIELGLGLFENVVPHAQNCHLLNNQIQN